MDPSLFAASTPQYIMPDGGTTGKGKFEFALGHIGWAVSIYLFIIIIIIFFFLNLYSSLKIDDIHLVQVGTGFFLGCARGAVGEFFNPETRKMVIFLEI